MSTKCITPESLELLRKTAAHLRAKGVAFTPAMEMGESLTLFPVAEPTDSEAKGCTRCGTLDLIGGRGGLCEQCDEHEDREAANEAKA